MHLFHEFKKEDLSLLERYSSSINTKSYFYKPSFTTLWCLHDDTRLYEGEFGLYIYMNANGYFLMPLTNDMPKAIEEMKEVARKEEVELHIKSITEDYLQYFGNDFRLSRDRNLDEYIYLREKLEALSGKHLQSKRNHISQFMKAYPDYTSYPLRKEDRDEVLSMTRAWLEDKELGMKKQLEDEYVTIERAFDYWDSFDFSGAIIRVAGRMIAYTIGEKQNDTIVVHYEKADTSYHGSYAIINREYISKFAPDAIYVNRMEDAGVEGLRKAKESYKPIMMVEKWSGTLK